MQAHFGVDVERRGAGAGVADHHRADDDGEDEHGLRARAALQEVPEQPHVDHALGVAVERRVEEAAELGDAVGDAASAPSSRSNSPAKMISTPPTARLPLAMTSAHADVEEQPEQGQHVGRDRRADEDARDPAHLRARPVLKHIRQQRILSHRQPGPPGRGADTAALTREPASPGRARPGTGGRPHRRGPRPADAPQPAPGATDCRRRCRRHRPPGNRPAGSWRDPGPAQFRRPAARR